MSLRKSLYKNYIRNSASTSSFMNYSEQNPSERHWVRDWYDPPKVTKDATLLQQIQGNVLGQVGSGPMTPSESTQQPPSVSQSQTPQPPETYGFHIKTWILTEEPQEKKDCANDDDAILHLDKFSYIKTEEGDTQNPAAGSGLTEADIKSAVGGGGVSNNLFANSSAEAYEEKDKAEAEAKAAEVKAEATPKIEELPEEAGADADGDVEMK